MKRKQGLRTLFLIGMVAVLGMSVPCLADGEKPKPDPFVSILDADPMEMARMVDRLGDDAVLKRLKSGQPVEVRLAAVRAAVWMKMPELALRPLLDMMQSRDSELAPSSARTVLRIVSRFNPDVLTQREVDLHGLKALRAELDKIFNNELIRMDIRMNAAQASEQLSACGVN